MVTVFIQNSKDIIMKRFVLLAALGFTLIITQALEAKAAKKTREITIYPFSGPVDDIMALAKPNPSGIRAVRSMVFNKRYLLMPSTTKAPAGRSTENI